MIPILSFLFGLCSLCMAFVHTFGQAIAVRFCASSPPSPPRTSIRPPDGALSPAQRSDASEVQYWALQKAGSSLVLRSSCRASVRRRFSPSSSRLGKVGLLPFLLLPPPTCVLRSPSSTPLLPTPNCADRKDELGFRLACYIVCAPLAGAVGGLLASAILKIDSIGPYRTWRNIFLVEGIITMGLAIISWFVLPDRPEVCKWLTPEERRACSFSPSTPSPTP